MATRIAGDFIDDGAAVHLAKTLAATHRREEHAEDACLALNWVLSKNLLRTNVLVFPVAVVVAVAVVAAVNVASD